MKLFRFMIIAVLLTGSIAVGAQTIPTLQQKLKGAVVAYAVTDIATGKPLAQWQETTAITPASITKLITTASALEMLGADYRFKTYLEYDGVLKDSVLEGNLYVRGGGDPTLGSEFLGDPNFMSVWVDAVRRVGIAKICGDVVADASAYDNEGFNPRWTWMDVANYYASGVYGISIADNTLHIMLKTNAAGTVPEIQQLNPNIPELVIENYLRAEKINFDSAYLYGLPLSNVRTLRGAIPCNRQNFVVRGDIPNPPLYLAQLFKQNLEENGVTVSGKAAVTWETQPRNLFFTHYSPMLKDIVKVINFYSNNHYAEHLFKQIAFAQTGSGSNEAARHCIKNFWQNKGLDVSSCFQYDGSGLARENMFTVQFFNDVLLYMKIKSRNADSFAMSLPKAGKEGTVRNLFKGKNLQENMFLKSGSMSRVQSYSGYIDSGTHYYAVTVVVNNFLQSRAVVVKEIQEWLLDVMKMKK